MLRNDSEISMKQEIRPLRIIYIRINRLINVLRATQQTICLATKLYISHLVFIEPLNYQFMVMQKHYKLVLK